MDNTFAIYIHWPFCASKCPYCDFNSSAADKIDQKRWKSTLLRNIESSEYGMNRSGVKSIFFGGGTPSLIAPNTVAEIINLIHNKWGLSDTTEITLEANPTSAEADRFKDFRKSGITRLSLGVQSFSDRILSFLGRTHTANEARHGIALAKQIFPNYSFDLIYGHPGQNEIDWQRELEEAILLADGHMSLYQLTIEPGTTFHKNNIHEMNEEAGATFYELAQDFLKSHGYITYEISNFARPGKECRHNLACWQGNDYLGIGPGAHGRLTSATGTHAVVQIKNPEKWLIRVEKNGNGTAQHKLLSKQERCEELLLTGLRLNEGINRQKFYSLSGTIIEQIVNLNAMNRLIEGGFLELNNQYFRASKSGRLRLNAILVDLLTT